MKLSARVNRIIEKSPAMGSPLMEGSDDDDVEEPITRTVHPRRSDQAKTTQVTGQSQVYEYTDPSPSSSSSQNDFIGSLYGRKPSQSTKQQVSTTPQQSTKSRAKPGKQVEEVEDLFDDLDDIDLDDINDTEYFAAIARSQLAKSKRVVEAVNINESVPISATVSNELLTSVKKLVDRDDMKLAHQLDERILKNNFVGEFRVPVSDILLPGLEEAHRPLYKHHIAEIATSMQRNKLYSPQPAILTLQLSTTSKMFKLFEAVRTEKDNIKKYKMFVKTLQEMRAQKPRLKFLIHGSTHSVAAYILIRRMDKDKIDDQDIEYPVKVFVNLSPDELSMVAGKHNVSAGITLKESSCDIMANCRKLVVRKASKKPDGEYLIDKTIRTELESMYGKQFNQHLTKALCLVCTYRFISMCFCILICVMLLP